MGFFTNIANKLHLSNLFDTVRKSEWVKNRPILNAVLNNPLVDNYFQRDLNDNHLEDASFEKKIAVAAAKTASQYLGFDRERAKQTAIAAADFVRDTRRVYQYEQNKISESEFNKHKEVSWWSRVKGVAKAAWEVGKEKVKEIVAEKGISTLLKTAAKVIPNPIVQTVMHVWDAIPEPIKTKVKEGAKKIAKTVVEKIPVVAEKVWEGAKTVAHTCIKVIEKGVEKAKEVGRKVVEIAKPVVNVVKNVVSTAAKVVSKTVETVKNIGKKIFSFLGF